MRFFLPLLSLLVMAGQAAAGIKPPPVAAAPLSDSLTRYFLARAMTMQGLNSLPRPERRAFARWAGEAGARFAGRVGGFWYTPENAAQERAHYDTLRQVVAELHQAQPGMVVQGSVFEIVYAHVNNLPVPNAARAEFGEDTVAVPARNFRVTDMAYPQYFDSVLLRPYRWDDRAAGQAPALPDLSRPESQLWFYCCARQLLNAGCEAIHFGQVMLMAERDPGHQGWWSMLQRVRRYARTRNRGFVLCDAHTHGEYYDPAPARPLPDSVRQLLFDFHGYPLRAVETDTMRRGNHGARLRIAPNESSIESLFRRSKGGLLPNGQRVRRAPGLIELDNWGIAPRPGEPGQWPSLWGLDEISWFANQPTSYRDFWLVYAVAYTERLDPNVQLELPGIRNVSEPQGPGWLYQANRDGQADIIPAIWAGSTAAWGQRILFIGPVRP